MLSWFRMIRSDRRIMLSVSATFIFLAKPGQWMIYGLESRDRVSEKGGHRNAERIVSQFQGAGLSVTV